ncbi:hypothetical protein VT84_23805 [Gemmata sp. SH-PL17]|nr:hypothetical protein VT84_23805 [Gemmata sp. SH-PL17]
MTEAQWLTCKRPEELFESSHCTDSRKRRLFACACARKVLHYLKDLRFQEALRASESLADGKLSEEQLKEFQKAAAKAGAHFVGMDAEPEKCAALSVVRACDQSIDPLCRTASQAQLAKGGIYTSKMAAEALRQAVLLRDIFGNPFRPAIFSPEWRTETAVPLAQQMYDARDFGAMPILADALQDAGCDSADVLDHCRGAGPHVRGCWVVDLVLGKA